MPARLLLIALVVVGSIVSGSNVVARAQAQPPSPCDGGDFCVGWGSGGEGHGGNAGGGNSGDPPPPCSWVSTTQDWVLFYKPDLPLPPPALAVIWQIYACPMGD